MDLENNIIGFHHVSIKANEFENTLAFYKGLGFEIVHSWSLPDFNMEKCVMLHHKAIDYYLEICDKNADMPTQGRKRKTERGCKERMRKLGEKKKKKKKREKGWGEESKEKKKKKKKIKKDKN